MTSKISKTEIPTLTGVRGIAALWVVLVHIYPAMSQMLGLPSRSEVPQIESGFLGVDLFFILSGFIMSYVHAEDFKTYSVFEHLRFLKLRLSRIFPLHVVCLLGLAIAVIFLPNFTTVYNGDRFNLQNFLTALFLVQNWGFGPFNLWNVPTWSLSAEWLAYLVFPFVIFSIQRFVRPGFEYAVAFFLLFGLITTVILSGLPSLGEPGKVGILRVAVEFTTGCLIYQAKTHQNVRQLKPSYFFWPALIIIAVCISDMRLHWGGVFALALLVYSLSEPSNAGKILFANSVCLWFGRISFSLYMCHWPVLQVFQWLMRNTISSATTYETHVLLTFGLLSILLLLATLLWKFVEVPSRSFLRQYIQPQVAIPKPPVMQL